MAAGTRTVRDVAMYDTLSCLQLSDCPRMIADLQNELASAKRELAAQAGSAQGGEASTLVSDKESTQLQALMALVATLKGELEAAQKQLERAVEHQSAEVE